MKKITLFFILVLALDQSIGLVLNNLYLRTTTGETGGLINYALKQQPDVLILGSSRACHHVSPAILQKKLSFSAFNAGIDGQDFLYAYMLFDLWTHSHSPPKVILLHVDPVSFDRRDGELQRTSVFSSYFDKSDRVREILLMRGNFEWIKYLSYSYRFNGKTLPILKNLMPHPQESFDGYSGLIGSIQLNATSMSNRNNFVISGNSRWDVKLRYLTELARYCSLNGTRLILFHSPQIGEDTTSLLAWSAWLERFLKPYPGCEYMDLSESYRQLFDGKRDLFKDASHLNSKGAEILTNLLADEIAKRIKAQPLQPPKL
jgi:hypothetical protein